MANFAGGAAGLAAAQQVQEDAADLSLGEFSSEKCLSNAEVRGAGHRRVVIAHVANARLLMRGARCPPPRAAAAVYLRAARVLVRAPWRRYRAAAPAAARSVRRQPTIIR